MIKDIDFQGKHVALVEPQWNYQVNRKSWYEYMNARYVPIGLLKLATLARSKGATVELLREGKLPSKNPDIVFVTSLFTYWWQSVWNAVALYRDYYHAKVYVGGIYASIMPEHCKLSGCDEVITGIVPEAECLLPAYDLLPKIDYCVIHASRGCTHKCKFCYTYSIEPKYEPKKSILKELVKKKVSFLDNNFLANPYIKDILNELIANGVRQSYCLSGVEANLVTAEIAKLMKAAKFTDIRIAFDREDEREPIAKALSNFIGAGYKAKEISVFMLYNFDDPFEAVESRRRYVGRLGAQIISQRYIPIPSLTDQHLHSGWTESQCHKFAANCREQSIFTLLHA